VWLWDARSRAGTNVWIAVILLALGWLMLRDTVSAPGLIATTAGVAVLIRALVQRRKEREQTSTSETSTAN